MCSDLRTGSKAQRGKLVCPAPPSKEVAVPGFEIWAAVSKPTLLPSPCYVIPPHSAWVPAAQLYVPLCTQKIKQMSSMEDAAQGWSQWAPTTRPPPPGLEDICNPPGGKLGRGPELASPGGPCSHVLRVRLGALEGMRQEGERGRQAVAAPLGGRAWLGTHGPPPAFQRKYL